MIAAEGILTSRGGKTSHAAVVARGMGKTCVSGADDLEVDVKGKTVTTKSGTTFGEGDVISIDGTSGTVYLGEVPVVPSPVVQYFEGTIDADADPLVAAVDRIITPRRRQAPARGAHQRRHRGGRGPGPPLRRAGHRPVPHRAHVPRRAAQARRAADPGRGRGRAEGGARRVAAAAARGLRRDLHRDGRAAGHGPADRPAAARVPARPHRAVGEGRGRRGQGRDRHRGRPPAARGGPPAARAEPDARPARRPARPGDPRAVRDAGARDRRGGGRR